MNKITAISDVQERLDSEILDSDTMARLRSAADQAAAWEVIHRPRADGFFQKRVHAARQTLTQVETQTCTPIAGGDTERSAVSGAAFRAA